MSRIKCVSKKAIGMDVREAKDEKTTKMVEIASVPPNSIVDCYGIVKEFNRRIFWVAWYRIVIVLRRFITIPRAAQIADLRSFIRTVNQNI
jgi:hypothetical protein